MNWYKTNKIDEFVIAYWTENTVKTAGIKDWWKGVKEDFADTSLMGGAWSTGKNAFLAITNALMGIAYPFYSLFSGDQDVWEMTSTFLKKAVKRIAKTIYSATQMGYGGVKLLKELASTIRKDLAQELQESVKNDVRGIYESHLSELSNRADVGSKMPKWHTENPEHFPEWFQKENEEKFRGINQAIGEVTENMALSVEGYGTKLHEREAA